MEHSVILLKFDHRLVDIVIRNKKKKICKRAVDRGGNLLYFMS